MNDVANLSERRRVRMRELLDRKSRWTAREALEAALADIDSGDLNPDAVVIFTLNDEGGQGMRVGRYVGALNDKRQVFGLELIGACFKALTDWSRGD
jgi:hypothetical protein